MPTLLSLLLHCWERAWMYLKKAGTVLVAISVLIWAAMKLTSAVRGKVLEAYKEISRMQF